MLVDWILAAFEWVIVETLGLFPTSGPDALTYVNGLAAQLGDLNYFLPLNETFALVVSVLVVFPLFMGTTLSLWILAQLRGSSSRG